MSPVFGATYFMLWMLVAFQAFLIVVLVHQLSDVRRRIEAAGLSLSINPLPIESVAPQFSAIDLRSGDRVHSSSFRGKPLVLLFLSTDCSVCRKLARELAQTAAGKLDNLVVYCNGAGRGCQSLLSPLSDSVPVLRKDNESVSMLFELPGFPAAVLLDEAWKIVGFRYPSRIAHVLEFLSHVLAAQHGAETRSALELLSAESQIL